MKAKQILALAVAMLICMTSIVLVPVSADTPVWDGATRTAPSGSGTESDPYLISTAAELAYVAQQVGANNASYRSTTKAIYYKQTADIYLNDVSDHENWTTSTVGLNQWVPIGSDSNFFTGVYDGQNHAVYGMYLTSGSQTANGLFGFLHTGADANEGKLGIVRNVRILNSFVSVLGNAGFTGGLVGRMARGAKILNCVSDTRIRINNSSTGIVGIGGICGYASQAGTIENCVNIGDISAKNAGTGGGGAAGIIGRITGGNSYTYTINKCYNLGNVYFVNADNTGAVGGIGGDWGGDKVNVSNCYNLGCITGSTAGSYIRIGGLAGFLRDPGSGKSHSFTNCFNLGVPSVGGKQAVFVYTGTPAISGVYYNSDLKTSESAGTTGLSMKAGAFVSQNMTGFSDDVWTLTDDALPTLTGVYAAVRTAGMWDGRAVKQPVGAGTEASPFLIGTAEELAFVAREINRNNSNFRGKFYYQLTNDVYLNDVSDFENWTGSTEGLNEWTPIGAPDASFFYGILDGNGHTVYGMYLSQANDYNGLVGSFHTNSTAGAGIIKDLTVARSAIFACGTKGYAAGIAGRTAKSAVIRNCVSDVKILIDAGDAQVKVGGITGGTIHGGTIEACVNRGDISVATTHATSGVGGIIGYTQGNAGTNDVVSDCVNYGGISLTTAKGVGGIAGYTGDSTTTVFAFLRCANYGSVSAGTGAAAGIVGFFRNDASCADCINYGTVSATDGYAGGIGGNSKKANVTITRCYNVGILTADTTGDVNARFEAHDEASGTDYTCTVTDCEVIAIENGAKIRERYTYFMDGETKVAEGQGLLFGGSLRAAPFISGGTVADGYTVGIRLSYGTKTVDVPANVTLAYNGETGAIDFTAHLIGIDAEHFDTEVTAQVYLKQGDTVLKLSAPVTRTVRQVAFASGGELDADGNYVSNGVLLSAAKTAGRSAHTAMSFNLLYSTGSGDPTATRFANAKSVILSEMPDSFGVQECQSGTYANGGVGWYELLTGDSDLMTYYGYVGTANDDGTNNFYNCVFYRKDRFNVLSSGTKWLSDTPDVCSTFEIRPTDQERIVTWVTLQDKTTGEVYTHFNTHLAVTRSAMQQQLTVLKGLTDACATPFVLTGDFNLDITWPEYQTLLSYWKDGRVCAPDSDDGPTNSTSKIMDFTLCSAGICSGEYHRAGTAYSIDPNDIGDASFLSDHYPVCLTFYLCA